MMTRIATDRWYTDHSQDHGLDAQLCVHSGKVCGEEHVHIGIYVIDTRPTSGSFDIDAAELFARAILLEVAAARARGLEKP